LTEKKVKFKKDTNETKSKRLKILNKMYNSNKQTNNKALQKNKKKKNYKHSNILMLEKGNRGKANKNKLTMKEYPLTRY